MSKHTPGPWKVNKINSRIYVEGGIIDNHGVCAHVETYSEDPSVEDFANANLIAAAPDLLAACEEALLAMGKVKVVLSPDAPAWQEELVGASESLRAAIAKAKGETNGK